jgi:hypothetical protein
MMQLLDADVVKLCDAIGASGHLKLEAVEQQFEQPMGEDGEMKEGDTGDGPRLWPTLCETYLYIQSVSALMSEQISIRVVANCHSADHQI